MGIGDKKHGATGYCQDFKFGKYYSEGNYQKDFLNGNIVDISLSKKTVYYGEAKDGYFTGKAYFFSNSNNMYCGNYEQGKFTGEGYRLDNKGKCIKGTWNDGYVQKVTSIVTSEGKVIPGLPKSFAEALNLIVEDFPSTFEVFGGDIDQLEESYLGSDDVDIYFSLISIPGSIGRDRIALDFGDNNFYASAFIETSDFSKAKAKYDEMGKLLKSVVIRNEDIKTGKKLEGTISPAKPGEVTVSELKLTNGPRGYDQFRTWLELTKNDDGKYIVVLKVGEQED